MTVRLIYRLFLYGKSPTAIASYLTGEGIPTPAGKRNWRPNTVESILTNEKYKGDALLQKSFTVDFLTKKSKLNEGRCHSIMWQTATRRSSSRRYSTLFNNYYKNKMTSEWEEVVYTKAVDESDIPADILAKVGRVAINVDVSTAEELKLAINA